MNYFLSVVISFGLLHTAYFEELQDGNEQHQSKELFPVAVNFVEDNKTSVEEDETEVPMKNAGLSSQILSELHDVAKNISHSKGIYRETEVKSKDELEIRRSIMKKVAVASESDQMKVILELFNSDENKLLLLEQMEYLVHQYDVAVNFVSQGGIQIITPFLFSSDDEIVSSVASVLGAAMQSNPTVQKAALKYSVGSSLLKLLSHKSPVVLSRTIFAMACFLRNSPEAQEEFISMDGILKFADVLKNDQISTNTKLKVINLFSDLATEQQTAKLYTNDQSSEKSPELERLFTDEMKKRDICKLIPLFLDLEDFDTHQRIITAMISVHAACHKDFKNGKISDRLKKLLKIYDPNSSNEGPLYPVIDKDLKKDLHDDLSILIKMIKEETSNQSSPMFKSEL